VMVIFFRDVLARYEQPTAFFALLVAWGGMNFLIEIALNIVMIPAIVRVKKVMTDKEIDV